METVLHHIHQRKRIHLKKQKYPHPNKFKRNLDYIAYFVAIIGPLIALPQIWKIYIFQNATGVSLLTWLGYMSGGLFWFVYGVAHKEKPILIMNIIWFISAMAIVIGILLFK